MRIIEMVETSSRRWEAQFVVEARKTRFGRAIAIALGTMYALAFLVMLATDFK